MIVINLLWSPSHSWQQLADDLFSHDRRGWWLGVARLAASFERVPEDVVARAILNPKRIEIVAPIVRAADDVGDVYFLDSRVHVGWQEIAAVDAGVTDGFGVTAFVDEAIAG